MCIRDSKRTHKRTHNVEKALVLQGCPRTVLVFHWFYKVVREKSCFFIGFRRVVRDKCCFFIGFTKVVSEFAEKPV